MVLEVMVYGVSHETEPTSFQDAISGPESKEWIEASQFEVSFLQENHTWEPCCLPPGMQSMQRCIVSTLLAVILTLDYT
jgi:hypothetical protein